MKHYMKLLAAVLGAPIVALADCEVYPNSTHTLTLPATITVPESLPVGSVITRQRFSGTAPGFAIRCPTNTQRTITGKYPAKTDPATGAYHTEVPGVGLRITITDARGVTNAYGLFSQSSVMVPGTYVTFTSAEATFYKIGPVTTGVMTSGDLFMDRWGTGPDRFLLTLGNSVRFVSPVATCDLAVGDVDRTISLAPVQVSAFQDATTAGARDFELTANCSDAAEVTFRFSGTPAPGNDRVFANTGTAGGVALWLYSRLNGGTQDILPNGTENTRTVAVSGNRAVLPLGAAYHKNGTVTQGTLASTATVNITYN